MSSSIDRRSINRGETLGFMFSLTPRSTEALTCQITLLSKRGGADLMTPRTIDIDSLGHFTGTLSETETDIAPGEYFLVATLTGSNIRRELEQRFTVRDAW